MVDEHSIDDNTLLKAAMLFDKVMDDKANPGLELWDPRFVGYDLPFTITELALAIIEEKTP